MPGTSTSEAEVTNISRTGLWILVDNAEPFLPFAQFPWFKDATLAAVLKVEQPRPEHLHRPDLDVDLTIESIQHLDRYPLEARGSEAA